MTRETKTKLITIISTLNAIIVSTAHFLQSCIEDIFGGTHFKVRNNPHFVDNVLELHFAQLLNLWPVSPVLRVRAVSPNAIRSRMHLT
jgi:hypothetical protein